MKSQTSSLVAACLIVALATNASAQSQPPAANAQPTQANSGPASEPPLRQRLTDEAIRDAVKQTLASEDQGHLVALGKPLSADPRHQQFGRKMSDAKIPDCLHGDALKFQPTFLGGLLAIPFWALAAVRGKCR